MTQKSYPWRGVAPGSGIDAGRYNANEWWGAWCALIKSGGVVFEDATPLVVRGNFASRGVIPGVPDNLVVTTTGNNTIVVGRGSALVDGQMFYNHEAVTITVPSSRTNDYIVVRKNFTGAAYTPPGSVDADEQVPSLTARISRVDSVSFTTDTTRASYWDVPLAIFSTDAAGAVTLADDREFATNFFIVGAHSDNNDAVQDALDIGATVDNVASGANNFGVAIRAMLMNSVGSLLAVGKLAFRYTDSVLATLQSRFELWLRRENTDILAGVVVAPGSVVGYVDGNARGSGAVDWQGFRGVATQVASGLYSVISGGVFNTASGNYAVAGGGSTNDAGDYGTVSGGRNNSASGNYAFVGGGDGNTASDYAVVAGGAGGSASGNYSAIGGGTTHLILAEYATVAGGSNNTISADGEYAGVPGGKESSLAIYGQIASASGKFAAAGDAQGTIQCVLRRAIATHAVNTWYSLYTDGAATQLTIAASTAWQVRGSVIGITQNAAQQWGYRFTGLIERDNAGNTTLAGSTLAVEFESDANYEMQLVADDVNEALEIQVRRTGGVDYNIRWVATIDMAEVTFP